MSLTITCPHCDLRHRVSQELAAAASAGIAARGEVEQAGTDIGDFHLIREIGRGSVLQKIRFGAILRGGCRRSKEWGGNAGPISGASRPPLRREMTYPA